LGIVISLLRGDRNFVEDLAVRSDTELLNLTQRRRRLLVGFVSGLIVTAFVWITALSFPAAVSEVFSAGLSPGINLLAILLWCIPFAPPFVSVFALSHLLFPSPPGRELACGLMSTFEYRQKTNRRTIIFIVAGMFGALNCLMLLIAVTSATGH